MGEWEVKRLSSVCKVISGYAFKSEEFQESGVPVIKISNIGNGFCDLQNNLQYVDKAFLNDLDEKYILQKDSILISLTGSHITQPNSMVGRSCRYTGDTPLLLNQRAGRIIPKQNTKQGIFLYYVMQSQWVKEYIGIVAYGAANQANISPKTIEGIKIRMPDFPTQIRIADILSTYDDLIENNNRRIELLEKAAQELYKEWFVRFRFPNHENTKFVNGLPEGWEVKKVRSIVKRLPFGSLYKENELTDEGAVIVIDQSQKEYLGFHNNEPSHRASKENPIIIFGDHSCKMRLMMVDFSLAENVVPFTSQGQMPISFLYYTVRSLIETSEYKRHWTEFMNKKVLIPDHHLQKKYDTIVRDNEALINSLTLQTRNLKKQRDLLLPRLMSGRLEV